MNDGAAAKVAALAVPAAACALIVADNAQLLLVDCVKNMDRAYAHLHVLAAQRFEAFDGAFSHAGFRHPGPWFYYYLACWEAVLGWLLPAKGVFHVATLVLNAAALAGGLWILRPLLRSSGEVVLLFVLYFCLAGESQRSFMADYWNPYPIPALMIWYVGALSRFAAGEARFLSLIVGVGSAIAQLHVGTLPVLVSTCLASLAGFVMHRFKSSSAADSLRWPLVVSVALGVFLWAPVIIDVAVYGSRSNAAILVSTFLDQPGKKSVLASGQVVLAVLAEFVRSIAFLPKPAAWWVGVFLLVAMAIPQRHEHRGRQWLRILLIIGWGTAAFSVSRNFQAFALYQISYVIGLAALLVVVACGGLSGLLPQRIGLWASVVVAIFLLFSALPSTDIHVGGCGPLKRADRFIAAVGPDNGIRYRIEPEGMKTRGFIAFLALRFAERGMPVCFEQSWRKYVGRSYLCSYQRVKRPDVPERVLRVVPIVEGNVQTAVQGVRRRRAGKIRGFQIVWSEGGQDRRYVERGGRSVLK